MTAAPRSNVQSATLSAYSSKFSVARSMNARLCRSFAMISRAIVFESAMSVPTSIPSQRSAKAADSVRRGSTTISRVPFSSPRRTWWKKMGCAARAFEPHSSDEVGVLDLLV